MIEQSPDQLPNTSDTQVQTVLIDFDFRSPELLVIGGDPEDLSNIPTAPIKSLFTPWAVVTIVAHEEEAQDVANLLADQPELVQMAAHYAEHYFKEGIMELSLNALTGEQIRNFERNTGIRLPGTEEE